MEIYIALFGAGTLAASSRAGWHTWGCGGVWLRDDPCSLPVFTCVHSENAVNAERSERRNENAHVNAESERRNAEFRTQGERGESERRIWERSERRAVF